MRRRRGFTLIEMLVVISLLAVILPMSGAMIYLLLRAQAAAGDSLADALVLSRFSHAFHEDVHAARGTPTTGPLAATGSRIELQLVDSHRVAYSIEPSGTIERIVTNGQASERREEFRLPGLRGEFKVSADGREAVCICQPRLIGGSRSAPSSAQSSKIRIAAVIGRNRRFASLPSAATSASAPAKVGDRQ